MTESNKLYPNDGKSYIMSGGATSNQPGRHPRSRSQLKKAVLYSARNVPIGGSTVGADGNIYGLPNGGSGYSEIVTTLKKEFQFNPPTLIMGVRMAATDSEDSQQSGGNLDGAQYIGSASASVEMLFDRTAEVHAGTADPDGTYGEYARLGVAKDVLDVYAVLRGDPTLLEAHTDRNIRELTRGLTDIVSQGSKVLMGHRAAISYSHDLVIFGLIQNMKFRFTKFNHLLIPTFGYVDLWFDVHTASNTSTVRNEMGVAPGGVVIDGNRAPNTGDPASSTDTSSGWGTGRVDERYR